DVGPAPRALRFQGGDFVVLDPTGAPVLPVYSTNHPSLHVEVNAVTPEDWKAWLRARRSHTGNQPAPLPGRRVLETTLRVAGEPDALAETSIDLAPALADGVGQLVVSVRPTAAAAKDVRDAVVVWVQAT